MEINMNTVYYGIFTQEVKTSENGCICYGNLMFEKIFKTLDEAKNTANLMQDTLLEKLKYEDEYYDLFIFEMRRINDTPELKHNEISFYAEISGKEYLFAVKAYEHNLYQ